MPERLTRQMSFCSESGQKKDLGVSATRFLPLAIHSAVASHSPRQSCTEGSRGISDPVRLCSPSGPLASVSAAGGQRTSGVQHENSQVIPAQTVVYFYPGVPDRLPNNLPRPSLLRRLKSSAFVMQIKSFLKGANLRKQCQAFCSGLLSKAKGFYQRASSLYLVNLLARWFYPL